MTRRNKNVIVSGGNRYQEVRSGITRTPKKCIKYARKASSAIESLNSQKRKEKGVKMASKKQRAVLKRYGYPTEVSAEEAHKIISTLAKNGWKSYPVYTLP